MADETMQNEQEQDKKDKKAEKLRKRQEKEEKKALKRRKKLEDAGYSAEEIEKAMERNEELEEGGSKLAVFFVTLAIVAIWLAIFGLLIKMDVGGFGSTILKPLLQDVPYINRVLPDAGMGEENEEVSTQEGNPEYPYDTLDEAVERIKALEIELQNEKNANADRQDQSEALAKYREKEAEFEQLKQKFDEEVVFSDNAPDINEYRVFYESMDPANAEAIYKRVLEQQQTDEKLEEYVSMYSSMKPRQAAAIFNTMTKDLKLVAKILQAMDTESSSAILGAMDTEIAANLTKIMNPSSETTTN